MEVNFFIYLYRRVLVMKGPDQMRKPFLIVAVRISLKVHFRMTGFIYGHCSTDFFFLSQFYRKLQGTGELQ